MNRVGLWIFLAVTSIVTAVDACLFYQPAGEVVYVVAYAALCALAWWSALHLRRGRDRWPWLLIAACQSLWLAGDAYELLAVHLLGGAASVGLADVFWLGAYPLLAIALTLMARRRAPGRLRPALLDALILTAAGAAMSWQFIMKPLTEGYSLAEAVVPVLYPIADVVLLCAVLLIVLSSGARTAPTRLLLAGVVWYLVMDLSWNVLPYFVSADAYGRLSAAMLFGNALIIAAGLHPNRAELISAGPSGGTLHPVRVFFLAVALVTAPVLDLFLRPDPVALAGSVVCAVLVVIRFATVVREQERTRALLARQARHDPLTGLANRTVLSDRLARAERTPDGAVAVLYLDLDGFKRINDEYGHEAGDAVLLAVSARLSAAVREGDLVARLGGDEFVLLCPGVPAAEAIRLAERIIADVARPVVFEGHRLTVGTSIGVAATADASEGLVRSGDAAMYEAKRQGRGRWVLA